MQEMKLNKGPEMNFSMSQQKNILIKITFWLPLLLSLVLFWQCEENPQNVALTDKTGEIVIDTLYANNDATYPLNRKISTLSADRLQLGIVNGYTFRTIMRFSNFPVDTIVIDTAWIRIQTLGTNPAQEESPVEFTAEGYPIIEPWSTDTADVWDDYESNVDFDNPMGEMFVSTSKTDSLIFKFNEFGLERLNAWIDTVASGIPNNGMALDYRVQTPNFVKEMQGRNAINGVGPFLVYRYTIDSGDSTLTVTDSLLAIADAYLFKGQYQPVPDRLNTSTLDTPYVSLLTFNIDTLKTLYPEGIIVESANLQLPIDQANTRLSASLRPNLHMLPFDSDIDDSDVTIILEFFSTGRIVNMTQFTDDSLYIEAAEGQSRQILATEYVQRLLNVPNFFTGFYIEDRTQNEHLSTGAYYRFNNANPVLRPRLIVTSVRLPEERF